MSVSSPASNPPISVSPGGHDYVLHLYANNPLEWYKTCTPGLKSHFYARRRIRLIRSFGRSYNPVRGAGDHVHFSMGDLALHRAHGPLAGVVAGVCDTHSSPQIVDDKDLTTEVETHKTQQPARVSWYVGHVATWSPDEFVKEVTQNGNA